MRSIIHFYTSFIEKEEDDPDWVTAKSILTELLNNRAEMKSYDRSVMWNYWGYIYFSEILQKHCIALESFLNSLKLQ